MAAWPELDELKQVLDVTSTDWDGDEYTLEPTRLTRLLAAAIERTKLDVGNWDEYVDEPTDNLAQYALRMAELMALKPEVVASIGFRDSTLDRLMFGHRRTFGFA